jgi:hypothetical protein
MNSWIDRQTTKTIECKINFLGKDTLRCLALATVDEPTSQSEMDLTKSENFVKYEASLS